MLSNDMGSAAGFSMVLDQRRTERGASLAVLSLISPVLVVFLRHPGCTFCREALGDIARLRKRIEARGTRIVLAYHGDRHAAAAQLARYGLSDLDLIHDEDRSLYRVFGLRRGTLRQVASPKVLFRGLVAGAVEGHGIGAVSGDPLQMPGVFLLYKCAMLRAYRHESAADRPDYESISSFSQTEAGSPGVHQEQNNL